MVLGSGGRARQSARARPEDESGYAAMLRDTAADRSTVRGRLTQGQTGARRVGIPRSGGLDMARSASGKCSVQPVENRLCLPSERG